MSLLLLTRSADLRDALPPGYDRPGWHTALTHELATHLSPAHAAILARPDPTPEGYGWSADGAQALPLAALALSERRALLAAAGSILSDIRRLVESGRSPLLAASWPGLRECPDLDCLFAVDGRPVLAAWGFVRTEAPGLPGLLAAYDDGRPWALAPRRREPWPALGLLALLGLLLGLGLAFAERRFPPGVCRISPDMLALLGAGGQQAARTAGLEGELRGLLGQLRAARRHCRLALAAPLPTPGPAPLPAPPPVPPPPPAPPPPLPQQAWNKHDLGMLKGCWHRYTNMVTHNPFTGHVTPVTSWTYCFNGTGQGNQQVTWQDGKSCTNPVTAQFNPNGTLTIQDSIPCGQVPRTPRGLFLGRTICTRLSATQASCPRTELAGPGAGQSYPGMFRR